MSRTVLAFAFFIMSFSVLATDVSWNGAVLPQNIKSVIESKIKESCPMMARQEVFNVISAEHVSGDYGHANDIFLVEMKGRGYGAGDPDHHFLIEAESDFLNGASKVTSFTSLAECH